MLWGSVQSIEDHGSIISFGGSPGLKKDGLSGFLANDENQGDLCWKFHLVTLDSKYHSSGSTTIVKLLLMLTHTFFYRSWLFWTQSCHEIL